MSDEAETSKIGLSDIWRWLRRFSVEWTVGCTFVFGIGGFVWMGYQDEVRDYFREFLGLDSLATAEQIEALSARLDAVTGEDGIIQMDFSQSYVVEPVEIGENLQARFVLRRTIRGIDCIFEGPGSAALFRDDRNIPLAGTILSPGIQIGRQWTQVRSVMRLPDDLVPGRVTLTLSLRYSCDGQIVFDDIGPLAFILVEPE